MSRAYRISVAESLARHIQVDDGVCSNLELLPVLEKREMGALLAEELETKGFAKEEGKAVRREKDGTTVSVDLESGDVTVKAEGKASVNLETRRTAISERPNDSAKEEALRKAAKEQLEREAQAEEEALRRKVTAQLEGKLKDLKEELDGVVNRVTANALKKKAAQLGTVEEVHEDGTGNVTIKVRV